ncbi:MAG: tRNA (adenosine(37)-N6)-dimethylallyltransferase MiaA [Candidatus Uhrbacteria bacterium]|nr:tRNA (adenosine(37)-N6)-dimethylallyltransferase MiaA [Candidatus Uhrbacteria bacterium]
MQKSKLITIVGPTATGKTDLAIQIAKEFNGEIITADSKTIYRGMDIGTAKPRKSSQNAIARSRSKSIKDLFRDKPYLVHGIPHFGIDIVDPNEEFSVSDFKEYAEKKISDILLRDKLPILVGGTGLYISAVVDNLSFTSTPANEKLRQELDALDNDQLISRLRKADSEAVESIDANNRRRLIRAIEIVQSSGKSLAEQQTKGEPKYDVLQIGIELSREDLYERIDFRVDKMIAEGLVDEVRELRDKYGCNLNAMTGIGYKEICMFLEGYVKLRDAIQLIKSDSRHYAKRQMTWFKRDSRIKWVISAEEAIDLVKGFR